MTRVLSPARPIRFGIAAATMITAAACADRGNAPPLPNTIDRSLAIAAPAESPATAPEQAGKDSKPAAQGEAKSGKAAPALGLLGGSDVITPEREVERRIMALEQRMAVLTAQFERIEPALNRLVALERDIQTLVYELEGMVSGREQATSPLPRTTTAAAARAKVGSVLATAETAPDPNAMPAATAPTASWGIHVATYDNADAARTYWQQLRAYMPTALGTKSHKLAAYDYPQGRYYQLKIGTYPDSGSAAAACKLLEPITGFCEATRFDGAP